MEVGRNLLSSPPSVYTRTHLKNYPSPSSASVVMLHEQAVPAVTSIPITSIARHFPTSVLLQEQRDEYRPPLHLLREDKTYQAILDRRQMETEACVSQENSGDFDKLVWHLEHRVIPLPGLINLLPALNARENSSSPLTMQSNTTDPKKLMEVEPHNVVALAKKALSASKQAASLAEDSSLFGAEFDDLFSTMPGSTVLSNPPIEEERIVRSTRVLERRSKRRVPKRKDVVFETHTSGRTDVRRKLSGGFDPNDPLRLFLWGPETRRLLTSKEELELIVQVQDLIKLEEVKSKLEAQFGRNPTLVEWAKAVGISCQVLQSQLISANKSREKLICANLRMVVHIAKQYQERGLNLQDLLQEGSIGLMKSVEKFKPQAGCRFATYAYWWIRQSIRKAIFQHSRTIRLPENVYGLLSKVLEAKRSYIQEGNHSPTKEELATRVGMTVEKLEKLLYTTRLPVSMQQTVWADQDTTYQEITADNRIEVPEMSVAKEMMRRHVRGLLTTLSPRERRIIKLRFGIEDGNQKSLSEIGNIYRLSKERVRQLESRALHKLRQCLGHQGLQAYADLLV